MTTVIINDKTKKGKLVLELFREMGYGKIISREPNQETIAAIEDARAGKVSEAKHVKELLKSINA